MSYDAWKLQAPPDSPEDYSERCDQCRHCLTVDGKWVCIADYNNRGVYSGTVIDEFFEPCPEWEKA